jgi:hypothetical protein
MRRYEGAGSAGAGAGRSSLRGIAATWAAVAAIAVPVALAGSPALKNENIPAYAVALRIPASWVGLDPSRMAAQHVAFAAADPKDTGGFHANVNLLVTDVPPGTTTRKWLFGDSAAKYMRIGTLRTVRIHGATGLEYESSKLERSGGVPLYTLEFAFSHNGKAYLFTYTAPAGAKAKFKPSFLASARTIQFVVTPPGSA